MTGGSNKVKKPTQNEDLSRMSVPRHINRKTELFSRKYKFSQFSRKMTTILKRIFVVILNSQLFFEVSVGKINIFFRFALIEVFCHAQLQ